MKYLAFSGQKYLGSPLPPLNAFMHRPRGLRKTTRERGANNDDGSSAKNITQRRLHIMIFWSKNWQQSCT